MKNFLLSVILLISTFSLQAKINSNKLIIRKNRVMIKSYRDRVQVQNTQMTKIKAEINTLEKNLGGKNKSYLKFLRLSREIGDQVSKLKNSLETNEEELIIKLKDIKYLLKVYLVNRLDASEEIEELYYRRIFGKAIGDQVVDMGILIEENKSLQKDLVVLTEDLKEYKNVANGIYSLLADMELKKKELVSIYGSALKKRKSHEKKLRFFRKELRKMRKNAIANNGVLTFGSPLKTYQNLKYGKKGVTFQFKKESPLFSGLEGRVAYVGDLASFGKVIMLDHGNDIRSVMLGNILTSLKKGQQVKTGQLIGHVRPEGIQSSLIFEIRKKNVAQETILWLDIDRTSNQKS